MEHCLPLSPKVVMAPAYTAPQSIERSSAAQFVVVSGLGSANVRETTTAFGAAACSDAFRKRSRYSCDAPSPILDRANASYVDGSQPSRNSAASAQANWIGVAGGPGSTGAVPNIKAAAYGLDRLGWLAQPRRRRWRMRRPNSSGSDAANGAA